MNLIAQAKSNPITVAAVVVVLLCAGVLGWIYMQGAALEEDMTKRVAVRNDLQGFVRRRVVIPPENAGGQPREFFITINKPAIENLKTAFEGMGVEYKVISDDLLAINSRGHEPMDPNLLPKPRTEGLRYEIKTQYREALRAMLGKPGTQPARRLNAGMPPNAQAIDRVLGTVEREFRQTQVFGPNLTAADVRKLRELQRTKLMDLLMERAQSLHLYAETDLGPGFPFDTSAIPAAAAQVAASDEQIWEGQMAMWIQQDIVEAIGAINAVDKPNFNIVHAPIKRLLGVMVVPGSVGVNTAGGMGMQPPINGGPRAAEELSAGGAGAFGGGGGGQMGFGGQTTPGGTAAVPPPASLDPRAKLPADFTVSPSGRVTNPFFDVRHTWVSMVVNSRDIPMILDAFSRTNINTVLMTRVTDVDEYEALKEGFVYGTGDAVRLDMLVESIWFRQWTTPHMPLVVRRSLGILPPDTTTAPTTPTPTP